MATSVMVMATSVVGVIKMGNTVPWAGIEPTSLAFRASVLPLHHVDYLKSPLYPRPPVYAAPCLRCQCRLLYIYTSIHLYIYTWMWVHAYKLRIWRCMELSGVSHQNIQHSTSPWPQYNYTLTAGQAPFATYKVTPPLRHDLLDAFYGMQIWLPGKLRQTLKGKKIPRNFQKENI